MIVTTLMGGLGNQLFQYAAGRALALRTGRRLVLDATRLPSPADGGLRLLHLRGLAIDPGARIILRPGAGGRNRAPSRPALHLDHRLRRAVRRWTITEPSARDELVDLSSPPTPVAVLFGYWQSHRYHAGAEEILRRELTPKVAADGRVAALLDRLADHDIISVHVRRGDYVTDPRVAAGLGALTADYYERAIELVADRCSRPAFVVLSDDPIWAAAHLRPDAPTHHVELDGPLDPLAALALMARARHAVIANSSLSWWGARLAAHDQQTVIAPARWHAGRPTDPDHRLPPEWTRLT